MLFTSEIQQRSGKLRKANKYGGPPAKAIRNFVTRCSIHEYAPNLAERAELRSVKNAARKTQYVIE